MTDPSDEKAQPQIQPDMPPRDDGPDTDSDTATAIEDPELRSGQYAHRDQEPPAE